MKLGFSHMAISRIYREYRVFGKTSNLRHLADGKRHWKNGPSMRALKREPLNETYVQHFLKLPRISLMGHQQVPVCEIFNGPSLMWAFRVKNPLMYRC